MCRSGGDGLGRVASRREKNLLLRGGGGARGGASLMQLEAEMIRNETGDDDDVYYRNVFSACR